MGLLFLHLLLLLLLLLTSAEARVLQPELGEKRSMIGSRPPSCERRCMACNHCEAIQVPVVPQDHKTRTMRHYSLKAFMISSSSRDDSNYKPMNWKCKCGDMILNP